MKKLDRFCIGIRLLGTACLLIIASLHCHWSIALILTLLSISNEVTQFAVMIVARRQSQARRAIQMLSGLGVSEEEL